ncbi:hypothetical protein CQA57_01460 [Helicobacter anseris]|uniref:TolC family protein n=1 Tax=Helicobacter anseris TaxID=375926 RepID=A0A3D8JBH5_9HELI|nr:TolC family protein [Helicobacter anseris]RDU74406.1 hypothetical protein CQA57_01460 [Helicobacter anseris]
MKKYFLILFLFCFVDALDITQAIHIALQHSSDIKEQEMLKKQGEYLNKANYANLMPSIDAGYTLSYNIPSNSNHYMLNSLNIKFNYNLFNGLKDYYAILQSKQNIKTLQYNLEKTQVDIALKTKSAYISILQSQALLKILEERKKNIELQKNKAQQFVRQGIRAKNESLSMEILLANTILSIKNTELNLKYQKEILKQLLKVEIDFENLEDIQVDIQEDFNTQEIFQNILNQNPQYLALISSLDSAKLQNKSDFGSFLPSLDLSGTKFWYIDGNNVISTSYGLQSQIRLNATWNLFNGLRDSNKYQASKIYTFSLQNKIETFKRNLLLSLEDLIKNLAFAKEQYMININTLEQAEENYKIVNNRYAQGIATYTELIDAELLLNNARTNIAQAKYDFALLVAQIHSLENRIF